jgi:hypothetical protein
LPPLQNNFIFNIAKYMEKEIFEELQDIFLKIIFDDEKSIDQK